MPNAFPLSEFSHQCGPYRWTSDPNGQYWSRFLSLLFRNLVMKLANLRTCMLSFPSWPVSFMFSVPGSRSGWFYFRVLSSYLHRDLFLCAAQHVVHSSIMTRLLIVWHPRFVHVSLVSIWYVSAVDQKQLYFQINPQPMNEWQGSFVLSSWEWESCVHIDWSFCSLQTEKPLERFETRQFYKVTTTDDPVIRYIHVSFLVSWKCLGLLFSHPKEPSYCRRVHVMLGNIMSFTEHLRCCLSWSCGSCWFGLIMLLGCTSICHLNHIESGSGYRPLMLQLFLLKLNMSSECCRRLLLESEDVGTVFATDAILSTLMCSPRSMYSWDIVVQRVGNKLFFDKRDAAFDLLTVSNLPC